MKRKLLKEGQSWRVVPPEEWETAIQESPPYKKGVGDLLFNGLCSGVVITFKVMLFIALCGLFVLTCGVCSGFIKNG